MFSLSMVFFFSPERNFLNDHLKLSDRLINEAFVNLQTAIVIQTSLVEVQSRVGLRGREIVQKREREMVQKRERKMVQKRTHPPKQELY